MTNSIKTGEDTPLLSSRQKTSSWDDAKPVAKKPSYWYIIPPMFGLTFTYGSLFPSMVQLYTIIFCYRYYQQQSDSEMDIPLENCSIPEVQAIVSEAQAIFMFLPYATTLFLATYYGALSDQKGRRPVLLIAGFGNIFMTICYLLTIKYYRIVGISLLFIAPAVKGILAGDTVLVAAAQAYISDCTTPTERTLAFGHMMATIFLGTTLGPMTASFILSQTKNINNVFYMAFFIFIAFELYIIFILPESHDYKNHKAPVSAENQSILRRLNIFSALSILYRASSKHANRYALTVLASIQFLLNMLSMPPTLLYAMLEFGWSAYEGGLFISLSSCMRFIQMIAILPLLSRLFYKSKASVTNSKEAETEIQVVHESIASLASSSEETLQHTVEGVPVLEETRSEKDIKNSILFDNWMLRIGCVFETLGFIGYALANSSTTFAGNTVFHSFSMLAAPSIRSLMTTLVDPSQVGEMLGAMAVLEAVSMVIAQLGLNTIYSASVATMPTLTFYVCAAIAGSALLLTFFVRPTT